MPTYTWVNNKTGKRTTMLQTIAEMEQWETDHPNQTLAPAAPLIHSGRGLRKPEDGFRDHLREIKKKHVGSTINTF